MAMADDNPITQLLHDWRAGNDKALNELMPLVHDNLQHADKSERKKKYMELLDDRTAEERKKDRCGIPWAA